MSQKTKLRFFYHNILGSTGSTILASSTSATSDFSVDYLHNFLEVNSWQEAAGGTTARTIKFDAGVGNTYSADYFAIHGHNLNGSTLALDVSSDDFAASTVSAVAAFVVGTTGTILSQFTSPGAYRYWRFSFSQSTATAAAIQIMSLGTATELAYITPPFDPHAQEIKATINLSHSGYVTGIHTRYTERNLDIKLPNASTAVYASVKTWFETHGAKQFFLAWDATGSSADVWLMRPELRFNNPITVDKFRDISISLTGRKL